MGHQFFGFTPDSFEQFARAVALETFGPGVAAFGDGPDGGREAIFKGTVPYPHPPEEKWSGYGIIQAKCKAKTEGTEKDQKWAYDLLDKELELFVVKHKRTPKPEYYVYVTNVDLAAGGGEHGWDAAYDLVKSGSSGTSVLFPSVSATVGYAEDFLRHGSGVRWFLVRSSYQSVL